MFSVVCYAFHVFRCLFFVVRGWLLFVVVCSSLFVVGCLVFDALALAGCCLLVAVCCVRLAFRWLLFAGCCLRFAVCNVLFVVGGCSLLVVCSGLFVVLFVVCCL